MSRVTAVSRSPSHGFSKQPQPGVRLIAGEGVEGDAHRGITVQHLYHVRKDPTAPNRSQVHLLPSERLLELGALGFPLTPGQLGENVLTEGLDLMSLPESTLLHLGAEAVLELTGLRTPCLKIDRFRDGLQQYLWGERDSGGQRTRRAGVMSIVREGGWVAPGDAITLQLPPEPHHALRPV